MFMRLASEFGLDAMRCANKVATCLGGQKYRDGPDEDDVATCKNIRTMKAKHIDGWFMSSRDRNLS